MKICFIEKIKKGDTNKTVLFSIELSSPQHLIIIPIKNLFSDVDKKYKILTDIFKRIKDRKFINTEDPLSKLTSEQIIMKQVERLTDNFSGVFNAEILIELFNNLGIKTVILETSSMDNIYTLFTEYNKVIEAMEMAIENNKDVLVKTTVSEDKTETEISFLRDGDKE